MQRVGACVPEISHVIPLRVLQLLKSECRNSGVFWGLQGLVVRELRAELVNVRTVVAWRRARVVLAMGRQKPAAA